MKKTNGNGIIWDSKGNTILAKFVDGVFITDDNHILKKMEALGYVFTDEEVATDELNKLTLDELKAYAIDKKIDLGEATLKKDILEKILG